MFASLGLMETPRSGVSRSSSPIAGAIDAFGDPLSSDVYGDFESSGIDFSELILERLGDCQLIDINNKKVSTVSSSSTQLNQEAASSSKPKNDSTNFDSSNKTPNMQQAYQQDCQKLQQEMGTKNPLTSALPPK